MTKMLKNWTRAVSALAVAAVLLTVGCEDGGGDDSGGSGGSDIRGTWALNSGSTVTGNTVWFIHFKNDGSYAISNNADGSGQRVSGTYSQSGNTVTGPFTNPGVGKGRIDGVVTGGVLQLDFVEYWHTPNKHVPYAGRKI